MMKGNSSVPVGDVVVKTSVSLIVFVAAALRYSLEED
jgi:hypothetical protein